MQIGKQIRVPLFELYRKTAKEHGFSNGIIDLVLRKVKQEISICKENRYITPLKLLGKETYKQILIMKQTNINHADFLLDVYERFGKDSQSAIDFVRHNMAELIEDPKSDKTNESVNTEAVAIDLGLPSGTLWADRNVGAKSIEDVGLYFSWGNTDGHVFGTDYDFCEDYENTPGSKLEGDIDLEHDAARVNMGEPWQMPTSEQFQELYDNCNVEFCSVNGYRGMKFTSKVNGNSIFFACSGSGRGTGWSSRGAFGYYWSSSFSSARDAYLLHFFSGGVFPQSNYGRYYGFAVRPVQNIVPKE